MLVADVAAPLDGQLLLGLGTAVGIGALIGIEREHAESAGRFAGVRTLPLVALLGALTAAFVPELLAPAFLLVAGLIVVAYYGKVRVAEDVGTTTAVATALTFLYGVMAVTSPRTRTAAIVIGTLTTVALASKERIHGYVERIGREEMEHTLTFLILALVVLPLLPDRSIEPLLGLNPRFVWLMVVFVSGISLAAYLLTRLFGPTRGIGVVGFLGGMASSTATTVSMASRVRDDADLTAVCAFAAAIASVAMFPRLLVEVAAVNPALLGPLVVPVGAITVVGGGVAGIYFWRLGRVEEPAVEIDNPFRIRPALLFGAAFAAILVVSREGSAVLGTSGIYATAAISGLADADAITITLSRLAAEGTIAEDVAVIGIVVGAAANTTVKVGIAWVLGSRALALRLAVIVASGLVAGALSALLVV